jgi:hypothetical protein
VIFWLPADLTLPGLLVPLLVALILPRPAGKPLTGDATAAFFIGLTATSVIFACFLAGDGAPGLSSASRLAPCDGGAVMPPSSASLAAALTDSTVFVPVFSFSTSTCCSVVSPPFFSLAFALAKKLAMLDLFSLLATGMTASSGVGNRLPKKP